MGGLLTWLTLLHEPDEIVELRSFDPKPVLSGYFRAGDSKTIKAQLERYPQRTFYQTLNPVKEACYSRRQRDIIAQNPKETTSDNDIIGQQWILIDCDPVRASGVSSTDDEKKLAKDTASAVYKYLRNVGFSMPIIGDSGNGYHLLYKVRTGNADTIKRFLAALDAMFSTDEVKIDTAVFNPARVTKLYGTIAHKGADTPERPHRESKIIMEPSAVELTSMDLVTRVADEIMPKTEPSNRGWKSTDTHTDFDFDDFVSRYLSVKKTVRSSNAMRYILEECPFDRSHRAPDSAVFKYDDGSFGFKCLHNSCSGYHWHELREKFEPNAYDVKPRSDSANYNAADIAKLHTGSYEAKTEDDEPTGERMLDIADIPDEDRSGKIYVKTGIKLLDDKIDGFILGEVTVWSGGSGAGKSSIVSQIALGAVDAGHRVAMFSGELRPQRTRHWMFLQAAGRDHVHQDPCHKDNWLVNDGIGAVLNDELRGKVSIYNNDYGTKWEDVVEKAILPYIEKNSASVVVIDNLMALDVPMRQTNPNEAQSQIIKAIHSIAQKLNVHVHFIAHPRKTQTFLRKEDISGSADLTNMADNVIMVHRTGTDFYKKCGEFYGNKAPTEAMGHGNVLEIMKNRENGKQDILIPLYFEECCKTMSDMRGGVMRWSWTEKLDETKEGLSAFDWS